ncbi:hypothetical protein HYC85_026612 [Camellia sinensis]|uniref:non-specific serine/threonine protein kinase n=1 Tax=Camellia sinensis TaxID=4442 RepID=A0A7J7G420_CAMSI|nr:hypothetical protein HYC85_026612 [Camellia sinensis]
MEVAKSDSNSKPRSQPCNCYKAAILTETILDSTQTSNFKDRYVLGERLGWGQFGIIRACSDKLTGDVLACKSIAKDRLVTMDDVRNVKLEIEIMSKLSGHPNVVDLKAVYEDEDYVHLVMELCAGGELFHQLEKHGRFSEYEAQVLFRHLIRVVTYCHEKGIVHRDLKPENILLATKSFSSPIKLADFGLATYIRPGKNLHGTVGSPFYIAPEVLTGGYNQAADVWSAGVILYIILSGLPPFWGKTKLKIFDAVRAADLQFPPELWDRISASAKDLVTGMLCVDPSKRLTAKQVLGGSNELEWLSACPRQSPGGPKVLERLSACPRRTKEEPTAPVSNRLDLDGYPMMMEGMDSLVKLFMLDPSLSIKHQLGETEQRTELRRGGGTNGSKFSGIHSKRNHTIGLGELDQLDLIVTESVIRWASCTHVPSASSLRSSLVC